MEPAPVEPAAVEPTAEEPPTEAPHHPHATPATVVKATLVNNLPDTTTIHWHGIALRNDMDGVPDLTQKPVPAAGRFVYEFSAPDPGTYFTLRPESAKIAFLPRNDTCSHVSISPHSRTVKGEP